jgi:hypothetical protein
LHRRTPPTNERMDLEKAEKEKFEYLCMHAVMGDAEDMQRVLEYKGFAIDNRFSSGENMLHRLASNHQIDGILVCIEAGADVNSCNDFGETALHLAIRSIPYRCYAGELGNPPASVAEAVVRLLIYYKANVRAKNDRGETPLHVAASVGEPGVLSLLLDQGAYLDIYQPALRKDWLPLDFALNQLKEWVPEDHAPPSLTPVQDEKHASTVAILTQARDIGSWEGWCMRGPSDSKYMRNFNTLFQTPREIYEVLMEKVGWRPIFDTPNIVGNLIKENEEVERWIVSEEGVEFIAQRAIEIKRTRAISKRANQIRHANDIADREAAIRRLSITR